MIVLAINSGSASLKFKLINMPERKIIVAGSFKNYEDGKYSFETESDEVIEVSEKDYTYSVEYLFSYLMSKKYIEQATQIDMVVNRVVHGGEKFREPVEITEEVIEKIGKYTEFSPLHNPYSLGKIKEIKKLYPEIRQLAVFDTSFHLTNPKENYLYGLPFGYYENLGVRRFGFHGISHKYVSKQIELLNGKEKNYKLISCHLGSGSSVCLIVDGKSMDHSFGFTPDENLIMATRVGEVDYDAVNFVKDKLNLNEKDVERLLNKESGLLGISGYTKDMKVLLEDYKTNERAKLAIDMFILSIVKYIAYFYVLAGGCDYLTFTGGIGSGSDVIRKMICEKLEVLNIKIHDSINDGRIDVEKNLDITDSKSKTKIWIIPTDEEVEMANQVYAS